MLARTFAVTLLGVSLGAAALATPPKPSIQDDARQTKPEGRTATARGADDVKMRNAMALRGGVSEDMWLESLHRLTRVPSPRREQVTRLVRAYVVASSDWRATQAPEMKRLTEVLVAARKAGEQPPVEVVTKVREIRSAMPRLSTLQEQVWEVLNGPEQSRLVDEIDAVKKSGLPKDVVEGRRPAGSPAVVTTEPAEGEEGKDGEEAAVPAPLLWSFVDDPQAGKPLPEPESDPTSKGKGKGKGKAESEAEEKG